MKPENERLLETAIDRLVEVEKQRHTEMFKSIAIELNNLAYQQGIPTYLIEKAITETLNCEHMTDKYRQNASKMIYSSVLKGAGKNG